MPTSRSRELTCSNEKLRAGRRDKAFTFSAIQTLKRGPSLKALRGTRVRPISTWMTKAESDQCSNSVLRRSALSFRFPKRNSVHAAPIHGSRADWVQAELILSIGRHG